MSALVYYCILLTAVFAVVVRAAFKTLVILAPLLGLTWFLGFISIHNKSLVFQYLFSVINSLQVNVIQFYKTCARNQNGGPEGWGGGGEVALGNLHLKINILGHLFVYIVQKRYLSLKMVKEK